MRTKRWSARLLAVSLTLSLLPAGALAAEGITQAVYSLEYAWALSQAAEAYTAAQIERSFPTLRFYHTLTAPPTPG